MGHPIPVLMALAVLVPLVGCVGGEVPVAWSFAPDGGDGPGENHAPEISEGENVIVTMSEDGHPTAFHLTLHATDADLDGLTWSIPENRSAQHGAAVLTEATGDLVQVGYVPGPDFNGDDAFTVVVIDSRGGSDEIVVSVVIEAVNDAPVITEGANVEVTLSEDGQPDSFELTLHATDVDGDALTWSIPETAAASHGQATAGPTGLESELSYVPVVDYHGTDEFSVVVSDGQGGTDTAVIAVIVVPINDAPLAVADTYSTREDEPLSIATDEGVLANDTDLDKDSLTAIVVTGPSHGALTLEPDGSFAYTPEASWHGEDAFTYKVSDGDLESDAATVAITVLPVNDMPTFTKGADQVILEDAGPQTILHWATDMTAGPANEVSQSITFLVSNDNNDLFEDQPSVDPDGVLTFTPAANANGLANVTVRLQDDGGTENGGVDTSAEKTFTFTVRAVNDAPSFTLRTYWSVLSDGAAQTRSEWAYQMSSGPADEYDVLDFIVTNDANSLFTVQPAIAPNGTLTFTPKVNASGSATVTVYLHDNGGTANGGVDTSAMQTFTIEMTPPNRAPVASNVTIDTPRDTAVEITLDATDEDGDTLTYSIVGTPGNGSLGTITGNKLTFTPTHCFTGANPFTYQAYDGTLYSNTATVNLTVSPVDPVIHRVDLDAVGGQNNGTSWADAFVDLHTALAYACPFDEIWVAEGTYKPHETDRLVSFQLREDVHVYGGFDATEALRSERSWTEHPTILSGELGDVLSVADNTEHILLGANGAIFDGFTVTHGYTSGSYGHGAAMLNNNISRTLTIANCRFTDNTGNPAVYYTNGAVVNNSSVVVITDCTFVDNHFTYAGALDNEYGNVKVSRCSFISNSAAYYKPEGGTDGRGGAVQNYRGTSEFIDCWFEDNFGAAYGGAIHIDYGATSTYNNCVFFHNGGSMHGGAINIGGRSSVSIRNSAFVGNYTGSFNGYGCGRAVAVASSSGITVLNTIFRDNYAQSGPDIATFVGVWNCPPISTQDNVTYSNIQYRGSSETGYPDPSNISVDPLFVDAANPKGPDGIPMTADDGMALKPLSPCINSGTDTGASLADILGNTRPYPGWPTDMGAYESQSAPCVPTGDDVCNGLDDDCDGLVDGGDTDDDGVAEACD